MWGCDEARVGSARCLWRVRNRKHESAHPSMDLAREQGRKRHHLPKSFAAMASTEDTCAWHEASERVRESLRIEAKITKKIKEE